MKNKLIFRVIGITIFIALIIVMYIILSYDSASYMDNGAESNKGYSNTSEEAGYYYDVIVPDIDYSTAQYRLELDLESRQITMPLHTDKTMLTEVEKEKYLLQDYKENFYFGSLITKQTNYSLIEIYPENRDYSFYYYEICSCKGMIDNGIIDRSSGVKIDQLLDLVWVDFGYGSNDNYVRFYKTGSQPDISQIMNVPVGYDIYCGESNDDDVNLIAYYTYNSNIDFCIKIMDIFDNSSTNIILNRNFAEMGSPKNVLKFLNNEEIYIEYEWCDEENKNWKIVQEIVNFKSISPQREFVIMEGESAQYDFIIKEISDGYQVNLYNDIGRLVLSQTHAVEPVVGFLTEDIIQVRISTGSPSVYVYYFNKKTSEISTVYFNPIIFGNTYIAYMDEGTLVLSDIFEHKFNMQIMRDFTQTADPISAVKSIEMIDDSSIRLKYYSGDDYLEQTEIINIDKM